VRNFPILFRMYYTSVTHSILLVHTCMITCIFQYSVTRNLETYFSSQTYKWGSTTQIYIFSAAWNWSFILKIIWSIHIFTDLISSKQRLQHVRKLHMWFFCLLNTVGCIHKLVLKEAWVIDWCKLSGECSFTAWCFTVLKMLVNIAEWRIFLIIITQIKWLFLKNLFIWHPSNCLFGGKVLNESCSIWFSKCTIWCVIKMKITCINDSRITSSNTKNCS